MEWEKYLPYFNRKKINKFNVEKLKWIKWANSIGYFNNINRFDNYAIQMGKKFELKGAIAPGMYLASYAQNFFDEINNIKIRFRKPVYNGTMLDVSVKENTLLKKNVDKEVVCQININLNNFEDIQETGSYDFVYKTKIDKVNIEMALYSLGVDNPVVGDIKKGNLPLPWSFLVSKSTPALKEFFGEENGVHVGQSARIYNHYEVGDLEICIKELWEENNFKALNLYWIQKGELIASGEGRVAQL